MIETFHVKRQAADIPSGGRGGARFRLPSRRLGSSPAKGLSGDLVTKTVEVITWSDPDLMVVGVPLRVVQVWTSRRNRTPPPGPDRQDD
jgi:hypothetical protein